MYLCCPLAMLRDGGNYFILDFMHSIAHIQILKNLLANSSHGKKGHILSFFDLCMKHEVMNTQPSCIHALSLWSLYVCTPLIGATGGAEVVMTTAHFSVTHK